ncbi:uncharacterized protein LOC5668087 [Anopheles gambiae]|uniref:uncharacterized protein LOC5668087 n=1 Tax=Anopheles gambiae TaxID=7165 RepID=UPI002AC8B800|nr:uncharacterized protein LOC5668087 [Anopheles gambiae]
MGEPIVLILSADATVQPESIVERIRKHTNGQDRITLGDAPESIGFPYQIHTKYYDTQVVLCAHGSADLSTVPSAILNRTEGMLIYFDAKDRTFLDRLPAYGAFVQQHEIEFGILLCSTLQESSAVGVTYAEAKSQCTVLDVIELEPSAEDEAEGSEEVAGAVEATGVDELIQAMHNYIWSNERIIEAELNGFERLLTEVMNFQPNTSNWTRNERLMYAEELAEMFDEMFEEDDGVGHP